MLARRLASSVLMTVGLASASALAGERARPGAIDRTVVRWATRSSSSAPRPRFILARELAFEARVEALSEGRAAATGFSDQHIRTAIQRHITEEILAELPVDPAPSPKDVGRYAEDARLVIEQLVGGRAALNLAATVEGITAEELNALLRRRARASYYLDKMVAPMLQPSETDLRDAHRRGDTAFTGQPFEPNEDRIRKSYVAARLRGALDSYYRSVRGKVSVQLIEW